MKINIGNIQIKNKINIGDIKLGIKKVYPPLENLEATPTGEKQVFKHPNSYGYDEVVVNAVESDELTVIPKAETQVKEGLFNKVTVEKINVEEKTAELNFKNTDLIEVLPSEDNYLIKVKIEKPENLVPENIRVGKTICGQTGVMEPTWDTTQIRQCYQMFFENTEMEEFPTFNMSGTTNIHQMCYGCSGLKTAKLLNTSNVKDARQAFNNCRSLTTVEEFDADNMTDIMQIFNNCNKLINLGALKNLGKGYNAESNNYIFYKLTLTSCSNISHKSLMNIINGLYDLNLTYDVANGGTLYRQSLELGSKNLAKLTAEEIAIATNKGWDVT